MNVLGKASSDHQEVGFILGMSDPDGIFLFDGAYICPAHACAIFIIHAGAMTIAHAGAMIIVHVR